MKNKNVRRMWILAAAVATGAWSIPAAASPIFGSLSNFDVINDTGQTTRL